ncbi:MAG TPA: potassium-transporting ATPase subunit KdpC [Bacteroidales bacterium]|nr:potassium-transporting ATPase subunit KdpC [Bacteroidales bacterium]
MKNLVISFRIFLFLTILTGILYPLLITGTAQTVFPDKASGSIVIKGGKKRGSLLIGQEFSDSCYFTSRPSHISYNPLPSGGSNYALTNRKLRENVLMRRDKFIEFNELDSITPIPSEMLFSSASGLDPHISPEAALLQVKRIGRCRNFPDSLQKKIIDLINFLTEEPQFHMFGQKRINVFLLNLSLDTLK